MHRWQPGDAQPRLYAQQAALRAWLGPGGLAHADGAWRWIDAARIDGTGMSAAAMNDATPAGRGAAVDEPPGRAAKDVRTALGAAIFNPLSAAAPSPNARDEVGGDGTITAMPRLAALLALGLAGTAVMWWSRRKQVIGLGLLGTRATQVDAALRGMAWHGPACAGGTPRHAAPDGPAEAPHPASAHEAETQSLPAVAVEDSRPGRRGDEEERAKPPRRHCRNRLDGPNRGPADDLRRIKGIGPKLERLLHDEGVHYYWQIAEWDGADVAAIDGRLTAFKGRIDRNAWVRQAAALAQATAPVGGPAGGPPGNL